MKKMTISKVNNWATRKVNNWATFGPLKNRQRGPVINFANFGFPFFIFKKSAETPIFIVFIEKHFFIKNKRGPVINFEMAQTWPTY